MWDLWIGSKIPSLWICFSSKLICLKRFCMKSVRLECFNLLYRKRPVQARPLLIKRQLVCRCFKKRCKCPAHSEAIGSIQIQAFKSWTQLGHIGFSLQTPGFKCNWVMCRPKEAQTERPQKMFLLSLASFGRRMSQSHLNPGSARKAQCAQFESRI